MDVPERERTASVARQEAARLTAEGVRGIALTWVDNAGLTRVKAIPTTQLAHAARRGIGMSPVFDVYLVDDSATSSRQTGGPAGDLRLFPDLKRLTELSAQPGWAWAPVDRYTQSGAPHPGCQRQFARRQAERAAARGIELRMGFETEWTVTRVGEPAPARDAGDGRRDAAPGTGRPRYASEGPAYGMTRVVELSDYLHDVLTALAAQHIDVLQIHPEYSPGQFEVSVAPASPVGAADLAVLVRETVRAVSVRHGLTASFGPVVEAGTVGNGAHLHLSLWEGGRNLCRGGSGPSGMTAECEAFLAGVLRELPALLVVGVPSPAGYLRLRPSRWAGAFRCWGVENREAALRFIPGAADDDLAANAEVKCFDGAANPYLVVGAVTAAGLAGLAEGLTLPPPVAGDPAVTGEDAARLPSSLPEALEHFERSELLREAMGGQLFEAVAAVRRAEAELFDGLAPQAVADATRDRY
ncbi:glutamine synthetase family protein [Streptomyces sp. NPDC048845]|uniref:glutamine synthetase family protein n=1 Tax=Streptomyces sp. NPDC048845 TaxID=3155390 RepID=UPI00344A9C1A